MLSPGAREAHPVSVRRILHIAGLLVVGCAGPHVIPVWSAPPASDPDAERVAVEFPDGTNGTELVLGVLAHAKELDATGVSGFEIEVGGCTRAIAAAPAASEGGDPVDRVVARVREMTVACRRQVDQEMTRATEGNKL